MVKVGVIGLGMMGGTHLDVYAGRDDVEVIAIADTNPARLSGEEQAGGNIEGQAQGGFNLKQSNLRRYDEGKKLIQDQDIDLVDICLPTQMHAEYAKLSLRGNKHTMVEKPVVRHYREAGDLLEAAEKSQALSMCGMCMRFWPGWTWLKQAVDEQRYGKVLAATFRRVTSHPGGPFYADADQCGGAALDLHIHDTDFVYYLFGAPKAVSSVGYSKPTAGVDHLVTRYEYDDVPLVVAEGGWAYTDGYGFTMRYTVNFERATASFDIGADPQLTLVETGGQPHAVDIEPKMGYELEIDYLIDCIKTGRKPERVTLSDAAQAVRIVEAEVQSAKSNGRPVKVGPA